VTEIIGGAAATAAHAKFHIVLEVTDATRDARSGISQRVVPIATKNILSRKWNGAGEKF
jgi:hypothetical protein